MSWKGLIYVSLVKEDFPKSHFYAWSEYRKQKQKWEDKLKTLQKKCIYASFPQNNLNNERTDIEKIKKRKVPMITCKNWLPVCLFVCLCPRRAGWLAATHEQMAVRWSGLGPAPGYTFTGVIFNTFSHTQAHEHTQALSRTSATWLRISRWILVESHRRSCLKCDALRQVSGITLPSSLRVSHALLVSALIE